MIRQHTTFETLTLELSRAEWAESWHQKDCRARAASRPCAACEEYERDWLAADDALNAYLDQIEVAAR